MIERKNISATELLLSFSKPLPISGTFYADKNTACRFEPLMNILFSDLAQTILLTADFIYLQSPAPQILEDLQAFALAEIEDWFAENQTVVTAPTEGTETKAKIILKTIVAPFLQKDGGDIRAESYADNILKVRFLGKCNGCAYAAQTLKQRVEKNLIRYLPEIQEARLI